MHPKLAVLAVLVAACGTGSDIATIAEPTTSTAEPAAGQEAPPSSSTTKTVAAAGGSGLFTSDGVEIPFPPTAPRGPVTTGLAADLESLFVEFADGTLAGETISAIAGHGDARTAWVFADLLRFTPPGPLSDSLVAAYEQVTGVTLPSGGPGDRWKDSNDYLIAWDLPAVPDYPAHKERLYIAIEPGWAPFFADPGALIDWRLVGWGGVFIDDRPLGVREGCPRGCIPALDDPLVTDAAGGSWYADDRIVFGVTINGESRAYPKHQMETHEMVNDTLGGRRVAIPYCTLCGSAQAYFTDSVPSSVETPVLRTSGLLYRSNKIMYDVITGSIFDTFTGQALTGPLREAGIRLDQTTVVASTWGAWKQAHPDTTILAEDGGVGFVYRLDPLGGRDDQGPIFPVGDVDPRLPVQELVIGIELGDGRTVAFPKDEAVEVLRGGGAVQFEGFTLELDGSGLRVNDADGREVAAHESFWFAWSQFWPDTELWHR